MITVGFVVLGCRKATWKFCVLTTWTFKNSSRSKLSTWQLKLLESSSFCKNIGFGFTKWQCWCQSGCSKARDKQEKGKVANLAVHFFASSSLKEYFRLLAKGKMRFCFTQSPALRRHCLSQGLWGNLFWLSVHTQLKLCKAAAPTGSSSLLRGRWWAGQTVLPLLCFWTPGKCSMTLITWSGQFWHLFQITELKLSNPWCIHLFFEELFTGRCSFHILGLHGAQPRSKSIRDLEYTSK